MKILIVLAHPEPKSFNYAMYQTAIDCLTEAGHVVKTSNLYQMNFNPVSDRSNFTSVKNKEFLKLQLEEVYATEVNGFIPILNTEQEKVEWCDLMIWQFPLWWFSMPAILKGWADRVFAMGRFFGNGHMFETGVLKGKKALVSTTTGSPAKDYVNDGIFGDINKILLPIHRYTFEVIGFSVLEPQISYAVAHLTDKERKLLLEQWSRRLQNISIEDTIKLVKY